ncbi:aminoglycoside phosphotransferase family protein [Candidatus Woesearchaeota archaeon]|nr:aminoglycoside phosphotransferase family protein [Candidatus Woesearchaeota archaeon]
MTKATELLRGLRFEQIRPGRYVASVADLALRGLFPKKSLPSFGDYGTPTTFGAGTRGLTDRGLSPEDLVTKGVRGEEGKDKADFFLVEEIGPVAEREKEEMPKKPKEILALEQILTEEYGTAVTITSVRELPTTRKKVKEVHFHKDGGISKVWIIKAEPQQTAQELNAYYLVHEQGIPTARPIGYKPATAKEPYPYNIAILGGVVEHAGEPYDALLQNMGLSPHLVFATARSIARLIADYQMKLTAAKGRLEAGGIQLRKASPRREIKERFLAALGKDEKDALDLIEACESLYQQQSGLTVVSHGDTHTGNIVTIAEADAATGLQRTSIEKFGVIDWGSVQLDHPLSDLVDFWVHHRRQAEKACGRYDVGLDEVVQAYGQQLARTAKQYGIPFEMPSQKDVTIQLALWNLYEMHDPTRKDPMDIGWKSRIHGIAVQQQLEKLEMLGYREQARTIHAALGRLLKDRVYKEKS